MTAKIGKLSLIFGAILNVLFIAACAAGVNSGFFDGIFGDSVAPNFWFMLIPFGAMLFAHLAAWLIAGLKARRARKRGEQPEEKPNSFGVFFKAYFYLWIVVAVAIAVCGILFFNFPVMSLPYVLVRNALVMGAAWLCAALVCVMIWAAFSAWAASEAAGIVMALVAFILLAGSSLLTGALYNEFAKGNEYTDEMAERARQEAEAAANAAAEAERRAAEEQWAAEAAAEAAAKAEAEEAMRAAEAAEMLAAENDTDRAFRFMKLKLGLENDDRAKRAVDVINNWVYNGNISYDYCEYCERYKEGKCCYGESDFETSKNDFLAIMSKNMKSSSGLLSIASYYSKGMKEKGKILPEWMFERSGAKDCLKILLWAHEDIYSKENSGEILANIYRIMDIGGDDTLSKYMSDETKRKVNSINSRSNIRDIEWANDQLLVWAYSFWGRRYNDGVDGAAYSILKTIEKMYE